MIQIHATHIHSLTLRQETSRSVSLMAQHDVQRGLEFERGVLVAARRSVFDIETKLRDEIDFFGVVRSVRGATGGGGAVKGHGDERKALPERHLRGAELFFEPDAQLLPRHVGEIHLRRGRGVRLRRSRSIRGSSLVIIPDVRGIVQIDLHAKLL